VLQTPHLNKFAAPTVEGIDFPAMGCYQAWNDPASGTLNVATYAASADQRGAATSFRIVNLPNASAVRITVDGQPFTRFTVISPTSIRIDATIDHLQYRIVTSYRGADRRADEQSRPPRTLAAAGASLPVAERPTRDFFSANKVGCACCSA
jgi:hypothetical protein